MAPRPAADNPLILLDGLLNIAWVLLRAVVVAQVIHTHPVVGSTAFWPTRPIPPLLLLRAKGVLLAVALIVVPVAAEALLMAAYGVRFGELFRVAAETALFATLWVALLAVPAVLTRTFSRFTLVCCGVLAALALYVAVGVVVSSIAPPSEPIAPQATTAIDYSGLIVFVTGLIVACGLTLAAQYRWRRTGRSAGVVVAGIVAAAVIADHWPWPVLRAEPGLPPWATPSSLSLSTDSDAIRTYAMTRNDEAWKSTDGAIEVAGLQPEWSAETALLEATLEIRGRRLTSAPAGFATPAAAARGSALARTVAIQRLLGAARVTTEIPPSRPTSHLLVIPEGEFERSQPTLGRYRGRHYVQLIHHTAEAMVPLHAGAAVTRGSYHLSVAAVTLTNRSARVRVRESNATSRFDRRVPREREFFVVNRRNGEAYSLGRGHPPIGLLPRLFTGVSWSQSPSDAGFVTQVLDLRFPPSWEEPAAAPITLEWLANTDLVVVTATREGALELPLVVPDFVLVEAAGLAP